MWYKKGLTRKHLGYRFVLAIQQGRFRVHIGCDPLGLDFRVILLCGSPDGWGVPKVWFVTWIEQILLQEGP